MIKHLTLAFSAILLYNSIAAQTYCFPFFQNGCWNWHNHSIQVGDINWEYGGDCFYTVFTGINTTLPVGVPVPMTVTSGVWTGCAVYADLNNDGQFDPSENLYSSYVGGEPYTYEFEITIPEGTEPGSYRLRVLAPWGSDGLTDANNNAGGCGYYHWGSFTDLTLNVDLSTGLADTPAQRPILALPDASGQSYTLRGEGGLSHVRIFTSDGRMLMQEGRTEAVEGAVIGMDGVPAGVYIIQCITDDGTTALRVVKG